MIKLYTAVGTSELKTVQGTVRRIFRAGDQIYFPNASELILWHSALFGIYTARELKKIFYENMGKAHLDDAVSFEWYLNHLEENGFIASGQDESIEDALYDLLKDLFIEVPRAVPFIIKAKAFFSMVWSGVPVKVARCVFRKSRYRGQKQGILSAAGKKPLTTAELVLWAAKDKELHGDLLDTVYVNGITQANAGHIGRFEPERMEVVKAVTELYLDREIMFEKLGVAK